MKSTILTGTILLGTHLIDASPLRRDEPQFQIQWGPCPQGSPSTLDCGQLEVPVDWSNPSASKIMIGMSRINATNSANKIGSVIFNPGGPGGVATGICAIQAAGLPVFGPTLTQNFDIICPDPRGVGTSTPVMCDPDVWNERVSLFPQTQAEFEGLVASNKMKGESCLNMTGPLLKHLDAVSVVKDFEAVRIALDDGPLNYLAVSYGSFLGITYAQLFPGNIRVMAIDGIFDHTQDAINTFYVESTSYENVLNRFFQWCATNATACGLIGDDLPKMFDDLVAAADKSPIPAPGCLTSANGTSAGLCRSDVTGKDILASAQGYLHFKTAALQGSIKGWDALGLALNQSIVDNNATLFSAYVATTKTDPLYTTISIACLDFDRVDTSNMTQAFATFQEQQLAGSAFNEHVGSASPYHIIQASCAGWPVPVVDRQVPLNQTALSQIPTILMVHAVHDPSTSYIWALSVKEQIKNAVLLTRQGDGHTSYLQHGQASTLMDAYLVNGTLPKPGTVVQS